MTQALPAGIILALTAFLSDASGDVNAGDVTQGFALGNALWTAGCVSVAALAIVVLWRRGAFTAAGQAAETWRLVAEAEAKKAEQATQRADDLARENLVLHATRDLKPILDEIANTAATSAERHQLIVEDLAALQEGQQKITAALDGMLQQLKHMNERRRHYDRPEPPGPFDENLE